MMFQPKEVSDAMSAFPAGVIHKGYLPLEKDIPKEFHYRSDNKWNKLFSQLFYRGDKFGNERKKLELFPKEGIDPEKAYRHIQACMGSYEPRHEHKVSGCSYLFSLWFEDYRWVDLDLN